MAELKYLDSPKMDELQAINLITKHFPIAVQAYIQTTKEKKFLNIWEKLGELETGQNKLSQDEQNVSTGSSTGRQNIQRSNTRYDQIPNRNNQIRNTNNQYAQIQKNYSQPRASTSQNANWDTNTPMGRQMSQQPIQNVKMQQQQYGQKMVKQISLHDEEENQENEVETEEEENDNQKNWEQGIAGRDRSQS